MSSDVGVRVPGEHEPEDFAVDAVDGNRGPPSVTRAEGGCNGSHRRLGGWTATLLVVASMVGTGVFTTSGFLIRDIGSPAAVLATWLAGGLLAICGALSYAELVAALPRNGGEYQLLTRIYHPAVGFAAGWISLVVGFSAPIAASALAFGHFLGAVVDGVNPTLAGLLLILVLSVLHAVHVMAGSRVQNLAAGAKVAFILVMAVGGLILGDPHRLVSGGQIPLIRAVFSSPCAVGLILVSFSYSGWNGAAYLAGEVREPSRTLPRALLVGSALVTVLYLGLNAAFLAAAPASELAGVVEIAHVASVHLLGATAAGALSVGIAVLLVSSVSAMIMSGPRVYEAMGQDYRRLGLLAQRTKHGGPVVAVALQGVIASAMLFTATFETLLTYIGFTLSVSAGLTVIGVFVLRRREPDLRRPYRTWGYPFTPMVFAILALWMIVHAVFERPVVVGAGLTTIVLGLVLFVVVSRGEQSKANPRDLGRPTSRGGD